MSVCRADQRKRFLCYSANTTLGWRVVRMESFEKGERMVELGSWRRVHDAINGNHIGYQPLSAESQRGDRDLQSQASSSSISAGEMMINAFTGFEDGRSRTAHLCEKDRAARHVPEDRVERVQCKVLVFPHVGPAKGDILRVWPK